MKSKILYLKWGITGEYDIELSMKKLGYDYVVFSKRPQSVDYDVEYMKEVGNEIVKHQCNIVFSLNFIPIVSRIVSLAKVKYVTWTLDGPAIMLYSKMLANECNHTVLFDRSMSQRFAEYGFPDHVYYQPLGSMVERLDEVRLTEEDYEKYGADVSFVGSLYSEKCPYNDVTFEDDYIKGVAEGLINAQLQVYGYNFLAESIPEDALNGLRVECGYNDLGEDYNQVDRELIADMFLGLKVTETERINMISAIADNYNISLYTQSDTSCFDGKKGLKNCGIVDYDIGMTKVFKASKINLNFTSKGIYTGIPLRVFDVLGAGGFLITNYQEEIGELFEIGEDLVTYENEQDLLNKIGYYLEHEDERKRIALNGYKKVKELYNMPHQLDEILSAFV